MQISVIVPVYNAEHHLVRCLDSLVNQSGGISYEIICIDDASADKSLSILRQYEKAHPNLFRVEENAENQGGGPTKTRGIRMARGDYLVFVDSDDFVANDYLATLLNAIRLRQCDLVIAGFIQTNGNTERISSLPNSDWTLLGFSAPWGKIYRKEFVENNGLYFPRFLLGEDMYFALCAFAKSITYAVIDYAGYYYCDNPDSITREKAYDKRLEQSLESMYDLFMQQSFYDALPQQKRRMIEYSYIADMLNAILVLNRGCGKALMEEKYRFFLNSLKARFPEYQSNPYLGLTKPKGQRGRTRLGVGAFKWCDRLKMTRALFNAFS